MEEFFAPAVTGGTGVNGLRDTAEESTFYNIRTVTVNLELVQISHDSEW